VSHLQQGEVAESGYAEKRSLHGQISVGTRSFIRARMPALSVIESTRHSSEFRTGRDRSDRQCTDNGAHMHRRPTRSHFDLLLRWEFSKDPLLIDQGVGFEQFGIPFWQAYRCRNRNHPVSEVAPAGSPGWGLRTIAKVLPRLVLLPDSRQFAAVFARRRGQVQGGHDKTMGSRRFRSGTVVSFGNGFRAAEMTGQVLSSPHFTIQKIADGVYAGIALDGGYAICNTGIIDLGDQTLVFDTTANRRAALDLKASAETLTGRRTSAVVLSHAHRDHVRGNQWFPGARLIATEKTREWMVQIQKDRREMIQREGLAPTRKGFEDELGSILRDPSETDADKLLWSGYLGGLLEDLEDLEYTVPNEGFTDRLAIQGSKRTAEMLTYGGGHTISDGILFLPESRVAFLGDLLFIGYQPYLAAGNPDELLRTLDRIERLDAKILVPGHGPVGIPSDIARMREYIEAVRRMAEYASQPDAGKNWPTRMRPPEPFRDWKWNRFLKDNLEYFLSSKRKTD
jgi:cyclase